MIEPAFGWYFYNGASHLGFNVASEIKEKSQSNPSIVKSPRSGEYKKQEENLYASRWSSYIMSKIMSSFRRIELP